MKEIKFLKDRIKRHLTLLDKGISNNNYEMLFDRYYKIVKDFFLFSSEALDKSDLKKDLEEFECLESSKGHMISVLNDMKYIIEEIEGNSNENDKNKDLPETIIEKIFYKFIVAKNTLKRRKHKKPDFNIKDEYDVQDLLHAFLKIHFEDVRPEEYVPSYAGSSSRVDFLLKNENIAIEVKMTRENLRDRQVGEELLIDIGRYKPHPNCKLLYCFVYDPDNYISNKSGLINDLNKNSDEKLQVKVFIEG